MTDWSLLFLTLPPIVAEVGLWTAEQESVTRDTCDMKMGFGTSGNMSPGIPWDGRIPR